MSKHISIGPLHLAVVPSGRECRITVRAWRQRGSERSGGWLQLGIWPLRVNAGRDVAAESLL
ncbi:hypothetical protein [Rothia halotolerans]|uniref:hypothetical protein n=1 Tax=Rothia halotolerans TaxID=405770 RepID=UPI00101B73EB|nr:hypothetical protein [Rothia halotolerans]